MAQILRGPISPTDDVACIVYTPMASNWKFSVAGAIRFWLDAHNPFGRNQTDPAAVYGLFMSCADRAPLGAAVVLTQESKLRAWTNCPVKVEEHHVDGGDRGVLFQIDGSDALDLLLASLGDEFRLTEFGPTSGPKIVVVTQKVG